MCSSKGIGHWITHSPITPPDSSAASQCASARLLQAPRKLSLWACLADDGIAQRCRQQHIGAIPRDRERLARPSHSPPQVHNVGWL